MTHLCQTVQELEPYCLSKSGDASRSALVEETKNHLSDPSYKETSRTICFNGFDEDEFSRFLLLFYNFRLMFLLPPQPPRMPKHLSHTNTSDSDVETLFDHVDSNVFDTYNAPETDSEASHSNSVNIDVTPNNH
ncbi:hypothetical protein Tco_1204794 [Tanacetum coccineum]